jgi:glycogen debranching enzyme
VTAGDRTYLIGTQDGRFPDMGQHIPGEMAGLWLPPIKLIDGFEAQIADDETGREALLGEALEMVTYPYGTLFRYGRVLEDLEIERFQFSPNQHSGLIIQYRLRNASGRSQRLRVQWSVKTNLRPTWYADRLGIRDAPDAVEWRSDQGIFMARDTQHPWYCVWGAWPSGGARLVEHPKPIETSGSGVTAASSYPVTVPAHASATLTFVISGSNTDPDEAVANYDYLVKHHDELLREKVAHYRAVINRARIRIPDAQLQEVYNWSRINMEWLVREVPGIGRGLSAGFMEYPWWFGTETYSLQALIDTGDFDLTKQTLRLLRDQSHKVNGNGRIAHEITTDGLVANRGNTQETAQFVMTVGKVYEWTGDLEFAKEMYPAMTRAIDWLLGDMDQNKDLFPEGYGIMEVYGLNAELIDVAVYTQQALEATATVSAAVHDKDGQERYRRLASELKDRINQEFWIEKDQSYADFYGSKSQAISAAEGAIKQIHLKRGEQLTQREEDAVEHYERLKARIAEQPDENRGWITNKNWVIATPMETGIAPSARAIQFLDKIRREDIGEYGPYLSAIERRSMMTIATGVQAVAEARYGRTDEAMWYVGRIVSTFNRVSPGSISEMMPDHGCFTIAWTSYGVVLPLIEHVFGIRPDAANRTVTFDPHLPSGWDDISIADLPVGTNVIAFSRARTSRGVVYEIQSKESAWTFLLRQHGSATAKYFVNGRLTEPPSPTLRLTGAKNRVLITD